MDRNDDHSLAPAGADDPTVGDTARRGNAGAPGTGGRAAAGGAPAPSRRGLYARTMLFGLWLPITQGLVFASRFHDLPEVAQDVPAIAFGLVMFYLVGCLTMMPFLVSHRRHPGRALLVNLVYLPFLFFAAVGSLMGGLLGVPGVIVGGTLPVLIPWLVFWLLPRRSAAA